MNADPIVARLTDGGIQGVEQIASLAVLEANPPRFWPATYVVEEKESAVAPRKQTGVYDQRVLCAFMVVIFVQVDIAAVGTADAELKALRDRIEERLAGWIHPNAGGQDTIYLGGQLLSLGQGQVGWTLRFQTERRIRKDITT